jgi:hypothetical protein
MLNSCRKFVWMKICYWKFEGNLNTHVPLWVQQHMVDRHYSLNLKPWSARTLYVYAHADLAQKYSVGLLEIFVPRLCSHEENSFLLPWSQGYRGLIPPRVPLLQYTSRKPLYNVYTVCEVLLSLTDRFRSRTQTTIKTMWKWCVVPMSGYDKPFWRHFHVLGPHPRSKSV